MSKLQILVATMFQTDFSKIRQMRIHSDVILANQADQTEIRRVRFENHEAIMITSTTRGVGMNRNIALQHATGEILLFADDDLRYVPNYEAIVLDAFRDLPDADAVIFNIRTVGQNMNRRENRTIKRVHLWNALNYGTVRIAVRREKLIPHGIDFNLNFGGGTVYSAGEDTLFLTDMLRHHFRIYTYPATIAEVDQQTSTWFAGYNRKYFYDKGALFAALSPGFALGLCLQDIFRHRRIYRRLSVAGMVRQCMRGIHGYRKLQPFS